MSSRWSPRSTRASPGALEHRRRGMTDSGSDRGRTSRWTRRASIRRHARVLQRSRPGNRWTFTAGRRSPSSAARGEPAFPLLDVGFGDGDVLRAIARWRAGAGSPPIWSAWTSTEQPGRGACGDAGRSGDRLPRRRLPRAGGPFDFIISSQVTHQHDRCRAARLHRPHGG